MDGSAFHDVIEHNKGLQVVNDPAFRELNFVREQILDDTTWRQSQFGSRISNEHHSFRNDTLVNVGTVENIRPLKSGILNRIIKDTHGTCKSHFFT